MFGNWNIMKAGLKRHGMRKKAEAATVKAPVLLRRSMKMNEKGQGD